MREISIYRSTLVTPASSLKMMEKAAGAEGDILIFDLEDAVAPDQKAAARENILNIVAKIDFKNREWGIRINGVHTPYFFDDLLLLLEISRPLTVVLPKADSREDVVILDCMLSQLEFKNPALSPLWVQVLIESSSGLERVHEVCRATSRVTAVIFGAGDYTADTGASFTRNGLFYARSKIVVAAAFAGIQPIDNVSPDFRNLEALEEDARLGKELGFTGKWAIHPAQVEVINKVFSPTVEEVKKAKKVIQAYEEAKAKGIGAISVDNQMIDEAVLKIMQRRSNLAKKVGTWDPVEL
jgi:citrate lyase subunit beta/citryl-CoA lyase